MRSGRQRGREAAGRALAALVAVVVLLLPEQASAHLVTTELGPFYDGAAHPLVSLEDLLTLVGFAVVASHAGRVAGRRFLAALVGAWTVGAVVGFALAPGRWDAPGATAAAILLVGAAGALRLRISSALLAGTAGVVGLGHGLINGASIRDGGGVWLTVAGVAAGLFVLTTLLAGAGAWLHEKRGAVVLRVVASWVAAIGLLMLGWQIRG